MDQITDNNGKIFAVAPGAKIWGADLRGRDFQNYQLMGIQFGPADMSTGWDLSSDYFKEQKWPGIKTDMSGADFSGANLADCYFSETEINESDFSSANLTNSSFWSVNKTRFKNTNLSAVVMEGFYYECDFEGAVLTDAYLTYDSEFTSCIFRGSVFNGSCNGVTFQDCDFTQATWSDFESGIVTNCKFDMTDLNSLNAINATFNYSSFITSNFDGANICKTTFSDCQFVARNFAGIIIGLENTDLEFHPELSGVWELIVGDQDEDEDEVYLLPNFYNSNLIDIDFSKCKLKNTKFKQCAFENCKFVGAQMDGTEFIECAFINCDIPEDLKPK